MRATIEHVGEPPETATRRPLWPCLALCLVSVVFCWEWLLPGRVLLPTDAESVWPWTEVAREPLQPSNALLSDSLTLTYTSRVYNHLSLREGRIPFWNPLILCGTPHFALIQNNTLYPLTLPFDLADPVAGMAYSICLHLALAGCLMYLFLRTTGLGPAAALIGGFTFELNGMFLTRLGMPCFVFSAVWLPLMLLGVDRLVRGGVRKGGPLLLAVVLSVLGGHPQITSLGLATAVAYLGWRIWTSDDRSRGWRFATRALGGFGLLVCLGLAVAAFQVIPFLELAWNSARTPISLTTYRASGVPAAALLQALLPRLYGDPITGTYWFAQWAPLLDGVQPGDRAWSLNASGENVFTGIAPLVLAGFALARSRRREVGFFAVLALGSLAIFLGTPLLDAAYWLVPGFRHSRPDRVLLVYMAAVSVLAALGVDAMGAGKSQPRERAVRRAVGVVTLALLLWIVVPFALHPPRRAGLMRWLAEATTLWTQHRAEWAPDASVALAVLLGSFLLIAYRPAGPASGWRLCAWSVLVLVPNMLFGWHFNPTHRSPPLGQSEIEKVLLANAQDGRLARVLASPALLFPANVPPLLGLGDIHGISAATPAAYLQLMHALDPQAVQLWKYFPTFRDRRVVGSRLLDFLNVAFILSDQDLSLPRLWSRPGSGVVLFRNPRALPRFLLVPDVAVYRARSEGVALLLSPAFDPAQTALIQESQASLVGPARTHEAPAATITVERSEPHAIDLSIQPASGGLLVSSDADYPGWSAWVDGRPVEILLVNTAFRGVWLPPGARQVQFRFVPRSFQVGVAVSLAGLLATALLLRRRPTSARYWT